MTAKSKPAMIWGVALIVLGGLFLAGNVGWIPDLSPNLWALLFAGALPGRVLAEDDVGLTRAVGSVGWTGERARLSASLIRAFADGCERAVVIEAGDHLVAEDLRAAGIAAEIIAVRNGVESACPPSVSR